jgi:hypothetical protein
MKQTSLLGKPEPIVTKVKMPLQAADASRIVPITCWEWCKNCLPEMHPSHSGVYRTCKTVGCKCYPVSGVCEWADPPLPSAPPKPRTSAWSDY